MTLPSNRANWQPAEAALVVAAARDWLGTPYRHQASCKNAGTDCLGLVRGVYRTICGCEPEAVPPYAITPQAHEGEALLHAAQRHLLVLPGKLHVDARADNVAAGEVLLFRLQSGLPIRHCAIALGNGSMIHAMVGLAVCEVPLTRWWLRHCAARFVFPAPKALPCNREICHE